MLNDEIKKKIKTWIKKTKQKQRHKRLLQ